MIAEGAVRSIASTHSNPLPPPPPSGAVPDVATAAPGPMCRGAVVSLKVSGDDRAAAVEIAAKVVLGNHKISFFYEWGREG